MMYPAGEFSIGGIHLYHSTVRVQGRPQAVHKGNTEDEESVLFPLEASCNFTCKCSHPAHPGENIALA